MRTFNPGSFAKQLIKASPARQMTIAVEDNDGRLVISVYAGLADNQGDLLGRHDTGLGGDADPADANHLSDQLAATLALAGIEVDQTPDD